MCLLDECVDKLAYLSLDANRDPCQYELLPSPSLIPPPFPIHLLPPRVFPRPDRIISDMYM